MIDIPSQGRRSGGFLVAQFQDLAQEELFGKQRLLARDLKLLVLGQKVDLREILVDQEEEIRCGLDPSLGIDGNLGEEFHERGFIQRRVLDLAQNELLDVGIRVALAIHTASFGCIFKHITQNPYTFSSVVCLSVFLGNWSRLHCIGLSKVKPRLSSFDLTRATLLVSR